MRLIFSLIVLIGVGLAGAAVYVAQSLISATNAELAAARAQALPPVEMVNVLVAGRPMRYGEPLAMEDVLVAPWPVNALPEGVYTDPDALFVPGAGARVILRAMEQNEPILPVKVSAPGADAGITSVLSRGMRAFTIAVNVNTGVGGFLQPGDFVDVFWTGRSQNSAEITRLIQSQLKLIAVDQSADQDSRATRAAIARNVTIEATPQQVAALAQAQSTGQLSLALVGLDDDTAVGQIEMDQNQLLGVERAEIQTVEAPQVCSVRTRRGGEVVQIEIPCTN
ncbi:Flp pilus assembly protein CpaB [Roseicitreum antarcticum]|uniref:Pilus assembly protein CpaB n=1 Tax=Roseicitreum antarcticum TaxID=564137 RepID=A0A1H2XIW1_9RHOB|nr:Flp pilus assembly protein CpaB [Roseicitreum antarcticum]SDW92792.1 pilus assembly protein CpaB [Roseicitreum antarcticum]